MLKKLRDQWVRLTGSPSDFPMESRIFHSIALGIIFMLAIYMPYNFFEGLYVGSLSAFVFAVIFGYQYYNSRYRGKSHSNIIFGVTGIIIFSVNYFTNSGIDGSTDLIWPVYLLLVIAISPYRQHLAWLIVYLICFFVVHFVAYQHPSLVQHPFVAGEGQFIDRVTAFPIPVIGIYIIIKYIRKGYDRERLIADEKALAVEVRNQQILLQTHELEKSNAEKDKLMSIISHDMRAPLINIQNYLELINEHQLDAEMRPVLEEQLLTATNSTMDMLTNMLQWSKSQMEGITVHLADINLLQSINSSLEMGKAHAAKKDISLTYTIDPQITVTADTNMLQLVMRNLISNAVKFTPPQGIINIEAKLISNECKIVVSDNGKGIDPNKQEKIFSVNTEPGFGTNNEKGVGLGLLLCKEFIELQGGRIGFESVFGQGSSFFIFVPCV